MDVGEIIKTERMKKGMTQDELAQKVGVQKSAVAKWENGRVAEIKRTNLKNLAVALGINPNLLLGDENADPIEEKEPAIVIEKEEPATNDDGLSESQRKLIEFAKTLDEVQAGKVLQLMQSILAFDK